MATKEVECRKCNGAGVIWETPPNSLATPLHFECPKCGRTALLRKVKRLERRIKEMQQEDEDRGIERCLSEPTE